MTDYSEDELAARRARLAAKKGPPIMSNHEYEIRMAQEYQRQILSVDKAPLTERKEAASDFLVAMKDPALIGERIGWIFDGNYGYGAMKAARRVVTASARTNKVAALCQMVAALEWHCPMRMAVEMWKKLSASEKAALEKEIKAEIDAAMKGID